MDRYHSIVGPMVSYHWKLLKNHCVQWLPDFKTIGINGCWTKNHCKTIDTNGCFPTLHLLANPSLFGIFFVEKGPASCSLINSAFYSPHLSHPKPKYKINCDHWKTIGGNGSTVKYHWKNHRYQWLKPDDQMTRWPDDQMSRCPDD